MATIPLPSAEDDRRRDSTLLIRLIEVSRGYLRWFILESEAVPGELRQLFADQILKDIEHRLDGAISTIQRIESPEDPIWQALSRAGLIGVQLQAKAAVLTSIQKQRRPSLGERFLGLISGVSMSKAEALLEWLNSFLGSLGSAIPGVEAVKECKDQLKLAINHQLRKDPPLIKLGLGYSD